MYVREKHGTRKEEWSEMRTSALASGSGAGFGAGAVSLITLERAPDTIAAAGSAAVFSVERGRFSFRATKGVVKFNETAGRVPKVSNWAFPKSRTTICPYKTLTTFLL